MKGKNQWMVLNYMLVLLSICLLVFYPLDVLAQNPGNRIPLDDQIFQDVVSDFAVYESLLNDVSHDISYGETKLLPIHANSMEEAVQFLSAGFCPSLSELIAGYYLAECSPARIQVIPMESIPIIKLDNHAQTQITLITNSTACVRCQFYNCYEAGDAYLYDVYVKKQESRWIIEGLCLKTNKI